MDADRQDLLQADHASAGGPFAAVPFEARAAPSAMTDALAAWRPDPALAEKLKLYGRFVGSWSLDIDYHAPDGHIVNAPGEWRFAWVLQGRAVQDVWIFPAMRVRDKPTDPFYFYGSTFRWYDPSIDAWRITWFDPTRPFELRQIGRASGADIVQMGEEVAGVTRRWGFVEITEGSFRWLGEASRDRGASWFLEMEMLARKVLTS
jgi:hypothetical protein